MVPGVSVAKDVCLRDMKCAVSYLEAMGSNPGRLNLKCIVLLFKPYSQLNHKYHEMCLVEMVKSSSPSLARDLTENHSFPSVTLVNVTLSLSIFKSSMNPAS